MEKKNIKTGIGPITDQLINNIIDKLNKESLREKLNYGVIYPLIDETSNKLKPYFYIGIGMYIFIIILLLVIIKLLINRK